MCISNLCEPYVDLATDVLKSQNPILFRALRDFLTGLPDSSCGEDILKAALHRLAIMDIEGCRWLLQKSSNFFSEVNFIELATEVVTELLQTQGLLVDQDFSFDADRKVTFSAKARSEFLRDVSIDHHLHLEEILHIYDVELQPKTYKD